MSEKTYIIKTITWILLCVLTVGLLAGCAGNGKSPTSGGDAPSNADVVMENIEKSSEEQLTEYISGVGYFLSVDFRRDHFLTFMEAINGYVGGSADAIAKAETASNITKGKMLELDDLLVPEEMGLSSVHEEMLLARNVYLRSMETLLNAMKDNCSLAEFADRREMVSYSMERFVQAVMPVSNQAHGRLAGLQREQAEAEEDTSQFPVSVEEGQAIMEARFSPQEGEYIEFGRVIVVDGRSFLLYMYNNEFACSAYCVDAQTGEIFNTDEEFTLTPLSK